MASRPSWDVGVNVHGGGDLGVAQDLHRDPRVDVEFNEQRRAGMAGAMDRDARHAGLGAPALKRPIQVPRIHRSAGSAADHEAAIESTASGRLFLVLRELRQDGDAERWQWEPSVGVECLGLTEHEPSIDALEFAVHVDGGGIEVDVSPLKTEQFAAAQAENQQQDIRRVERVAVGAGAGQELAGLLGGPGGHPTRPGAREADGGGRVVADQPPRDCLGQGGPEDGAGVDDRATRQSLLAALAPRAATSLPDGSGGVLALGAALACGC